MAKKISDKERLSMLLRFLNDDPITSNIGNRKWSRQAIDAAIREERREKGKKS